MLGNDDLMPYFLQVVGKGKSHISYTDKGYFHIILIVLKEFYFDSGPVKYCLIYEVAIDYVGLISLWHGVGARKTGTLTRIWKS